jgi:hypothetical protein
MPLIASPAALNCSCHQNASNECNYACHKYCFRQSPACRHATSRYQHMLALVIFDFCAGGGALLFDTVIISRFVACCCAHADAEGEVSLFASSAQTTRAHVSGGSGSGSSGGGSGSSGGGSGSSSIVNSGSNKRNRHPLPSNRPCLLLSRTKRLRHETCEFFAPASVLAATCRDGERRQRSAGQGGVRA